MLSPPYPPRPSSSPSASPLDLQALARRDREQQRAEDISPTTTAALPGEPASRTSRRLSSESLTVSSRHSISGASAPGAPSTSSCGHTSVKPETVSLPAVMPLQDQGTF